MTEPVQPDMLPETLQPNEIYVIHVTEHKSYRVRNPEYDPYEMHGFGGPSPTLMGGRSDRYWFTSTRSESALNRLKKYLVEQAAKFAWHDPEKKERGQEYETFEEWVTWDIKKERYTDK